MARREFPTMVRVAVIKRSTRENGEIYCEKCGGLARRFQIDHIVADAIGGKSVIENAMLICEPCWQIKNPQDTTKAAKVKRVEAYHLGASTEPSVKFRSRGFPPTGKTPRIEKQPLRPRPMFEDIK